MLLLLSTSAAETRFLHALPTAHAVWLNTQNCPWFGSQISLICCELSGALPHEPPHKGCCPWTLLGNFCPQSCFSSPNPGYTTVPKSTLRQQRECGCKPKGNFITKVEQAVHYLQVTWLNFSGITVTKHTPLDST